MKCLISNPSLGIWCRMVHNLAQVGDNEIYFDFADRIMTVSTTNSSLSTFATFILFKNFFSSYSMTSEEPEKVAIPAKIILKPYRTQRMAKNHISSEIQYNNNNDHVIITSEGKSHASSTYRLGASIHNEDIQFECDPYTYKNCLKADAKVLSNVLANFSHMKGLSELCLKIQGNRVTLRNTITDMTRKDMCVVTEYNLTSHDFIDFDVHIDNIEFAFGFREFKLYTTFAEQLKLPVNIHFENPEDPVIITVKTETFEARLCMATRFGDPFNNLNNTPSTNNPSPAGSNGRISNVTSQASTTSIRSTTSASNVAQERNRNRENGSRTSATATTSAASINNAEPPPAKRLRRTEAAPPLAELSQSRMPSNSETDGAELADFLNENVEGEQPENPEPIQIGPVIEELEKRKFSKAYIAIRNMISRPSITEAEYLRTIPGHDIVLCPDSDEEDASP